MLHGNVIKMPMLTLAKNVVLNQFYSSTKTGKRPIFLKLWKLKPRKEISKT